MKLNRIRLSFWLLVAGGMVLTSCTKNDESTISLIGTEYYIDDILSVIPDSLRTSFFADFGSIPTGFVPPKIEGSYVMAPKQRVAANTTTPWPLNVVEPNNVYLRFSKQHNGIAKMDLAEDTESFSDTIFVCGSGNAFAVYFIEDKTFMPDNTTARIKRGIIMKGNVTDRGISDFRYATINMEVEYDGPIAPPPDGSYFIYKDGNGLAEKMDW